MFIKVLSAALLLLALMGPLLPPAMAIPPLQIPYTPWFTGARNSGMGQADLASGSDPLAILNNPATQLSDQKYQLAYNEMNWIHGWELNQAAFAVQWEGLRLGLAREEWVIKNRYVTSNPLDSGVAYRLRSWVAGLSAQIHCPEPGMDGLLATSGLSWRSASYGIGDSKGHSDEIDFGMTLGYRKNLSQGYTRFLASLTVRNLLGAKVEDDDDTALFKTKFTQLGGTWTTVWHGEGEGYDPLKVILAYTRRVDWEFAGSTVEALNRWGMEMIGAEILVLRFGDHGEHFTNDQDRTWGAGLRLPKGIIPSLSVEFDYAKIESGDARGWGELFEGRVGILF